MKRALVCLALALTFVSYSCKEEEKGTQIEVITAEEMQQIIEDNGVQMVDVRTPEEYQEGYINGFQNIDYFSDTFEADLEELDKSKPVIVYCRSGNRSSKCAAKMVEKGFVKIYELDGGITQWKFKGYDVKTETLLN
ncbi:rhodanese-like domain-containing protein [Flavobacteriaceae sp. LMIT009]